MIFYYYKYIYIYIYIYTYINRIIILLVYQLNNTCVDERTDLDMRTSMV